MNPGENVLWPYLSFHISRGWLLSFDHLNDTFLKPGAIAGWYRFLVLTPVPNLPKMEGQGVTHDRSFIYTILKTDCKV